MPPWKPVDAGIAFANHRGLLATEVDTIANCVAAGCPEGERTSAPPAPEFENEWSLGQPDLVLKMDRPFRVPADGPDLYRSFALPAQLPEDRWVKAIELRPQARGVVHHALFFVDDGGALRSQRENDGQPGVRGMKFVSGSGASFLQRGPAGLAGGLGGYVPGAMPNRLPGGLARRLPADSDIVMQTHFHPTGKEETEQAELGLYFAEKAPEHLLVPIQLPPLFGIGAGIDIPAGQQDYAIRQSYTLPIDVMAIETSGHAHYLCRTMRLTADLPSGKQLVLLQIDDWDLDWQDQYQFAEPIDLPRGTTLTARITYDNSADNPENPFSPPRRIQWGRESTDEMGSITLQVIAKAESQRTVLEGEMRDRARESIRDRITTKSGPLAGLARGRLGSGGLLRALDHNRDGKLSENEIPQQFRDRILEAFDSNGDRDLDTNELEIARESMRDLLRESK